MAISLIGWRRMADSVDSATRSRMMRGIRSKDTRPEIAIRHGLHGLGFRYRLHSGNVPGKPDMTFTRYRATVFVNGCFWHGHDCKFYRLPGTRPEFWQSKIDRNRERDELVRQKLIQSGWRQLVIWECAVRGQGRGALPSILAQAGLWIRSGAPSREIRGH
jgi:DNA mismatch endonuclease, patch repair protein